MDEGGFSIIYRVVDVETDVQYVMKNIFEKQYYQNELDFYMKLFSMDCYPKGFPYLYSYGTLFSETNQVSYYLIFELLGSSINQLINNSKKKVRIERVACVFSQILKSIEVTHYLGFFHRDIKVDNILFEYEYANEDNLDSMNVYLIDQGLCCLINKQIISENKKSQNGKNIIINEEHLYGNYFFMGSSYQSGKPYSYKDDLEAWFYSLVYLAKANLPWTENIENSFETVLQMKFNKNIQENLVADLPAQIQQVYKYIQGLKQNEVPKYQIIYSLLEEVFKTFRILDQNLQVSFEIKRLDEPSENDNYFFDIYQSDEVHNKLELEQRKIHNISLNDSFFFIQGSKGVHKYQKQPKSLIKRNKLNLFYKIYSTMNSTLDIDKNQLINMFEEINDEDQSLIHHTYNFFHQKNNLTLIKC